MIGAWLVTSVNEWAVGQERVLVLTSVAIHACVSIASAWRWWR